MKQLEVVEILVLQLGVELDPLERDGAGEEHVHELAVRGPCPKFFHLSYTGQKRTEIKLRKSVHSTISTGS